MSKTTVYQVFSDHVVPVIRLPVAYHAAPTLWAYMGARYIAPNPQDWLFHDKERMQRLWDLARDMAIPVELRIALALTLDRSYAESEMLVHAAWACESVSRLVGASSHWRDFSRQFSTVNNLQLPGLLGVAIGHTSVNDTWASWDGQPGDHELPFPAVAYALNKRSWPF